MDSAESPIPHDPDDGQFVAIHEAGHAVAAIVVGLHLRSVDLKEHMTPDGQIAIGCSDVAELDARTIRGKGERPVMPHLIHSMAGTIAEARVNPSVHRSGCDGWDVRHQRRLAIWAICNAIDIPGRPPWIPLPERRRNETRIKTLLDSAHKETDRLVGEHWPAIEKVAAQLLERQVLSGTEVAEIVNAVR